MVGRFKNDGWTDQQLHAWSYDYGQSNKTTAEQLKTKVAEILQSTGATKVDVIAHSMGGLSSRYYAKYLQGDVNIDAWVSVGGPNHGTEWAKNCADALCVGMRVGSTFLTNTTDGLNHGDETPDAVRHGTWQSPCDAIVPMSSVPVVGGQSTDTSCVMHKQLQNDRTIYRQVRDFVASAS